MSIVTQSMHITPADGNAFADLGFEPVEAAALKAESQRIIADTVVIKVSLMSELAGWIEAEKLTHADAAAILGVAHSRLSDAINKKTSRFSIDALVSMLARAGKRVQISVR